MRFFKSNRVRVMDWPPLSPDLNPIENVWSQLKDRVYRVPVTSIGSLEARAKKEWRNLVQSPAVLQSLYSSMERRLRAVIANAGGITGY